MQKRIFEIGRKLQELEYSKVHTFLEAGANDGVTQSNTLKLEEMGWDGILIEPSSDAFKSLCARRTCSHKFQIAIGDGSAETVIGSFASGSLMGSCDKELIGRDIGNNTLKRLFKDAALRTKSILSKETKSLTTKVQLTTLTKLIKATGISCIDLMTLDIEGYEIPALKGLEDQYNPRLLAIETRKRDAFEINDLLLDKGYILA